VSIWFLSPAPIADNLGKRHTNVSGMYRNLPTEVARALRRRLARISETRILSGTCTFELRCEFIPKISHRYCGSLAQSRLLWYLDLQISIMLPETCSTHRLVLLSLRPRAVLRSWSLYTIWSKRCGAEYLIGLAPGYLSLQAKRVERPPLSSVKFELVLCTIT